VITAEGAGPQESDVVSTVLERRNGEAPLGYSGRTALRREQCNGDNKALLGNESVKQQWNRSDRFYEMTQYSYVNNGGEDVFCVVGAVVISQV
jgi:hypothetical protein